MTYISNTQRVAEQYAASHPAQDEYTFTQYADDAATEPLTDALDDVMDVLATFDNKLTDADVEMDSLQPAAAVLWMERYNGDFEFVLDVRRRWQRWGTLRVGTVRGLLNCMRAEARRNAPQPFAAGEQMHQFKPVIDLLAKATASGLKKPRLHLRLGENKVIIKAAPVTGRNAGCFYVTGAFEDDIYWGKIDANGDADAKLKSAGYIFEQLAELAADPAAFAVRQGRETICCMFCGRDLDTTESRTVGYGPICADKWGLPWGKEVTA